MSIWFGKPRSRFGKYMDKLKVTHGVTQQEIAEAAGVSQATMSELVTGKRQAPTMRTAKRIAHAIKRYDVEFSSEDFWGD